MIDFQHLTSQGQVRRLRRLAEHALTLYEIEPLSLVPLSRWPNTVFTVSGSDGSRYVLRVHPDGEEWTRARVESELWWLGRLRTDLDVTMPAALCTRSDESAVVIAVEGVPQPRVCVLFHWIDGRFLHRGLRPSHLEQVGRLTARLHDLSAGLVVPAGFERPRIDPTDAGTEGSVVRLFTDRWSMETAAVMRAAFGRARQTQEHLGNGPDTFGLIHADIHQTNYLFSGGQLRLIDFDDCGWGHYLYDLAVTLNQVSDLPHAAALRTALLAGYRQIRALSPAEEAAIDTFIMLRHLQDITWFLQEQYNPSHGNMVDQVGPGLARLERFLAQ